MGNIFQNRSGLLSNIGSDTETVIFKTPEDFRPSDPVSTSFIKNLTSSNQNTGGTQVEWQPTFTPWNTPAGTTQELTQQRFQWIAEEKEFNEGFRREEYTLRSLARFATETNKWKNYYGARNSFLRDQHFNPSYRPWNEPAGSVEELEKQAFRWSEYLADFQSGLGTRYNSEIDKPVFDEEQEKYNNYIDERNNDLNLMDTNEITVTGSGENTGITSELTGVLDQVFSFFGNLLTPQTDPDDIGTSPEDTGIIVNEDQGFLERDIAFNIDTSIIPGPAPAGTEPTIKVVQAGFPDFKLPDLSKLKTLIPWGIGLSILFFNRKKIFG